MDGGGWGHSRSPRVDGDGAVLGRADGMGLVVLGGGWWDGNTLTGRAHGEGGGRGHLHV